MRLIPLASTFLLVAATAQAGSNVKSLGKQFRRLDANRDDSLTAAEFAKLLPAKLTKNNALVKTQGEMFAWFDEDASGGIDLAEWLDAKTNTGSEGPEFSDEVVDELDANGDGKLAWKEFKRVIPKYVSAKTARKWFDEWCGDSSSTSYGASYTLSDWTGWLSVTVVGPDTANTYTGSTTVSNGSLSLSRSSLSIVDFGGYDISAQTSTYYLSAPVSDTPASSIDQSGSDVSE